MKDKESPTELVHRIYHGLGVRIERDARGNPLLSDILALVIESLDKRYASGHQMSDNIQSMNMCDGCGERRMLTVHIVMDDGLTSSDWLCEKCVTEFLAQGRITR